MINKIINIIIPHLQMLLAHKLRSFLTILGIIFGVSAVIAMMSIGEGARIEIIEQIKQMGVNNIFVLDDPIKRKQNIKKKIILSKGLNKSDYQSIIELIPQFEDSSIVKNVEALIERMDTSEMGHIIGVSPDYLKIMNLNVVEGRKFYSLDFEQDEHICIIGQNIKKKFFKMANPLGKKIQLNKFPYSVAGIIKQKILPGDAASKKVVDIADDSIFVPYDSFIIKNYTDNNTSPIDKIALVVKDERQIDKIAKMLEKILSRRHYYTDDFQIIIPKQLLKQKQETQKIFNIVMISIAGISLLVGGIGIMNIMLANVMERTREIGLRRALGATMKNIRNQFLLEAAILTVFGGVIGILVGYLLTFIISSYAGWKTALSFISIFLSFGISTLVGIIFGYYPAVQASRLNPIEALRHE